ncbi:hypothetical protein EYF80_034488 [Liparis tanakae]|uniref:Uncharacterized protein n=1 Tax=Liparis tanakae TaxID=230148 RepID=A0A4Z2GNS6_9TELE|nr:hypothetical protein EYF80_034488 [Liparis tanakae]
MDNAEWKRREGEEEEVSQRAEGRCSQTVPSCCKRSKVKSSPALFHVRNCSSAETTPDDRDVAPGNCRKLWESVNVTETETRSAQAKFWYIQHILNREYRFTSFSHLVNFPVAELNWDVDLMSILIHGEVEVSAEPLQLYVVPVLVVQQTARGNEKLSAGG